MIKKFLLMSPLVALAFVMAGCDKEEELVEVDDAPQWEYKANTTNYRNMTLIATVPAGMVGDCSETDQMAVFAGSEIVGVASPLKQDKSLYYIVIGAPQGDNATLTVKYYSATKQHIYSTGSIGVFEADAMLGSGTEPLILQFK